MVPSENMGNGFSGPLTARIACAACGHGRIGSAEDVRKTLSSARAWALLEDGKIHDDRACERCHGVLPIESQRSCPPCVAQDMTERQVPLF